jgi:PAT family beta-lactamase induction signal transducer AmpG
MEIYQKQSFKDSFKIYLDKRMIRILLLGIISGFPWVLIGSSLSLWLKEEGLSRSTIGWAGLIFAVYAFNYLWAPLIDRMRIPWLTNKVGHRRSWIIVMQLVILLSLLCWNLVNPTANLTLVIAVGLIIAIASATQDITVDALRIEQIGKDEGKSMQAGAAMAVVGWWTGYKLGGVIALNAAEYFEKAGFENYWQLTFLILGIIIIACNIALMFVHEAQPKERQESQIETDRIIEKDLSSAKKNYLKILGGILLIFSILELLPEFPTTKNLFPFLPLTILHYVVISILVGGLSALFVKRNAPLGYALGFILFVLFFQLLLSYVIVSIILGILGIALLNSERYWGKRTAGWIGTRIGGPMVSFFKKNGFKIALGILTFVFLFKIGEAFLGRMSIIFYKEIGFTKGDIALYSKGLGWITTVVFTLLGGLFAIRSGVIKAMFVAGILMASTNLLFSALSWYVQTISLVSYEFNINLIFKTFYFETSNHELFFGLSVVLDDMTAAFATVAFVAFISMLVDRTYTATQYALLASIGTAGRTTLAASSGAMVDWLNGDWGIFFIITAVMVIPSLIFLYMIKDNIKLSEKI